MKKSLFILSAVLMFFVACNKESIPYSVNENGQIHKVFSVTTVKTRTSLDGDGVTVKWVKDDEINVIARTTGNQYTFTVKDGTEGSSSAEFEGDINAADAEETVFYAVYPNVNASITKGATKDDDVIVFANSAVTGHRKYFGTKDDPATAIKDGFDSAFAPMTAVNDGSNMVFRHGAAFFKLKMCTTGVKTIKLQSSGSARFNGRPNYKAADGTTSNVESAQSYILAQPSSGTFEENATYYIPVLTKQSDVKNLTITYTLSDGSTTASVTTTSLNSTKLASGVIYDLKTPPVVFTPSITAPGVEIAQTATGGNITFEIEHPAADGVISIAETGGKTNPADFVLNTTLKTDHFEFTCDENGETSPRSFYVSLTYTYNGSADQVTKDIVITQAGAAIHKDWDFSSTEWQSALEDQASSACSETNGNTNVAAWTVAYDGLTYTSGSKDGKWSTSGYIQPNGAGSTTTRYFSFVAEMSGTLTITAASAKTSEERKVAVKCGTSSEETQGCTTQTNLEFDVSAGTVYIYPKAGIRFYRIKFDTE